MCVAALAHVLQIVQCQRFALTAEELEAMEAARAEAEVHQPCIREWAEVLVPGRSSVQSLCVLA